MGDSPPLQPLKIKFRPPPLLQKCYLRHYAYLVISQRTGVQKSFCRTDPHIYYWLFYTTATNNEKTPIVCHHLAVSNGNILCGGSLVFISNQLKFEKLRTCECQNFQPFQLLIVIIQRGDKIIDLRLVHFKEILRWTVS